MITRLLYYSIVTYVVQLDGNVSPNYSFTGVGPYHDDGHCSDYY